MPRSDYEESLRDNLGDEKYFQIYDYKVIHLGITDLIVYNDEFKNKPILEEFNGDNYNKLNSCIDYMKKFTYDYNQSNPNLLEKEGGNCQAMSIYFYWLCNVNSIDCKLTGNYNHEYCIVTIDGISYSVDIANKIVEEVNV